jgi:hypothetical protein
MSTFDLMMKFECEDVSDVEVLQLFADLIGSGDAWALQGVYGRTANHIIQQGYLYPDGSYTPKSATILWDALGDTPIDDNECIELEYLHFSAGTDREEIWHWFEETFGLTVAKELMYQ